MAEITEHSPYQIFAETSFPDGWETLFQERSQNLPKSLKDVREDAWRLAQTFDFPDRKDESWRWMDYKSLPLGQLKTREKDLLSVQSQLVSTETGESPKAWTDLPDSVIVSTLSSLLKKQPELVERLLSSSTVASDGKFAALATAMASDGLFVYVPRNTRVEQVISLKLRLDLDGNLAWTHSVIVLEENSEASIELLWRDTFAEKDGLHNGVLEVFLGDGARLQLDERQHFSPSSWNISHAVASLGKDANLEWNSAVVGAKSSKNFIKAELFGKGSNANIQGLMFPDRDQVVNLDTRQNHWEASTTSNLLFKSVAANDGRSIWHGMIYVDPKAQQTDAYQTNKNLILDDSADVKSIPGLEIHADDVKCSHGASVGKIDKAELFYLQARGIPEKEAQKLIVEGFFNQVVQSYKLESTREALKDLLIDKMERL